MDEVLLGKAAIIERGIARGILEHRPTDLSDFARRLIALGTQPQTST